MYFPLFLKQSFKFLIYFLNWWDLIPLHFCSPKLYIFGTEVMEMHLLPFFYIFFFYFSFRNKKWPEAQINSLCLRWWIPIVYRLSKLAKAKARPCNSNYNIIFLCDETFNQTIWKIINVLNFRNRPTHQWSLWCHLSWGRKVITISSPPWESPSYVRFHRKRRQKQYSNQSCQTVYAAFSQLHLYATKHRLQSR